MNRKHGLKFLHPLQQARQKTVAIVNDKAMARPTNEKRQGATSHALWSLVRADTCTLANPCFELSNSHDAGAEAIA